VKILMDPEAVLADASSTCPSGGQFSLLHLAGICTMYRVHVRKASLRSSLLRRAVDEVSLTSVKQGMFALLALLVALHAGFGCGVALAGVAIQAPCCGVNCPVPSSAGDHACCQAQNSGAAAEALSAKPSLPSLLPLVALVRSYVVMPALTGFEQAPVFQNSPPGTVRLALLCSRQI
jgi:hypothetical protein